jgi:hypothetical protein
MEYRLNFVLNTLFYFEVIEEKLFLYYDLVTQPFVTNCGRFLNRRFSLLCS